MERKDLKVNHLYGDKDGVKVYRKAPTCYDSYLPAFYQVFYNDNSLSYRAGYKDKNGNVIWRKKRHYLTESDLKYFVEW